MSKKKKTEMRQVMFRVDCRLLAAYDQMCRKSQITREGSIRTHLEQATGRKSIRRPGLRLAHSPAAPTKKSKRATKRRTKTRSTKPPQVDTPTEPK